MTWQWVVVIFISWCFLSVIVAAWFGMLKSGEPRDDDAIWLQDRPPLKNIKSVRDVEIAEEATLEDRVADLERRMDDRDTGLDPRS